MTNLIQKWMLLGRKSLIEHMRPGRDEAELLAVLGRAEAVQSDEQRTMLEQMIVFNDTRVREVMVPRSDIHAVTVDTPLADVERMLIDKGVSRLPVIEDDIDHVLGVVHAQDVVAARITGDKSTLTNLVRPCLRVLELEQVSGLLSEMKEASCHIAMVLDEYGGTAGLITLPDLLKEIVGEINEAGEADDIEFHPLHDDSYMVQARMHIEELSEALGVTLPQGDYDTVAGWITARLGRIPKQGETVKLDGIQIHVLEADPRRISKVRLQRQQDHKKV
ncbi:magnesium and cobalt transporter [Mariprofundus micogutta]|uniref:Magnesium and cobalt transporter n=1 Tax=Mariprofundus micogutta TaxID=1921010 RepID=A0A1L8CMB7_9PROT|nr:hemolysin family protein [Mariprofundus micogutta]GAV20053.1 magnesium and cobalt transporter [Mariprofundus micogutta]